MSTPFPKNNSVQIAENSILDFYNKQLYLGNCFVLNSGVLSLADTNEHPEILIKNASTNQKGFFFFFRNCGSSDQFYARFYLNPTISGNGTPATPLNLRPAYSTVSTSSSFTAPSVSGNGTLITVMPCVNSLQSSLMFILDPGSNILVTAQSVNGSGGSPTSAFIEAAWYEL